MNKRTKFYIGVALVISAITAAFTFISLCFKKKSALAALATIAAAEGLVGLSLIEDTNILKRKKVVLVDVEEAEEAPEERIEFDIPKDEEATEEDFA